MCYHAGHAHRPGAHARPVHGGAQPEARPLLSAFFIAHATRDWAAEVPGDVMVQAALAMTAMHRAMERGEYGEALNHLKVWAGILGVSGGDAAPE